MKPISASMALALLSGCFTATGGSASTGGNGVCRSSGETCSITPDCCSGFACGNGSCEFIGGNGGGSTVASGSSSGSAATSTARGSTGGTGSEARSSGTSGAPSTSGKSGTGTSGGSSVGNNSGGGSSSGASGNAYAGGWPKWHYDNADRGRSPVDTSGNTGQLLWTFNIGAADAGTGLLAAVDPTPTYMNSPVVDGSGDVYELGVGGTFYAVGPTGHLLWSTPLLSPFPDTHTATATLAADGTIYVECGTDGASPSGAQLYHLDAATGQILFQAGPPTGQNCGVPNMCQNADGFDVSPTLSPDGLLFDGDDFGQLVTYALNPGGSFTQSSELILDLYGERVAVALDANDQSYWCSLNVCYGLTSPASGFKLMPGWPTIGAAIGSADGTGTDWTNSDLAIDLDHTGWLIAEAGSETSTSTGSTEVVAMDPTTGVLHWDTPLPSGPTPGSWNTFTSAGIFSSDVGNSAPAIAADGTVYVGNVDGLYALNGSTGAINWSYRPSQDTGANADVDTAPAIGGDGTIFFATAGGTYYAVDPSGTERFHLRTNARISASPAIGPDGTVFFVSDNGLLQAVR